MSLFLLRHNFFETVCIAVSVPQNKVYTQSRHAMPSPTKQPLLLHYQEDPAWHNEKQSKLMQRVFSFCPVSVELFLWKIREGKIEKVGSRVLWLWRRKLFKKGERGLLKNKCFCYMFYTRRTSIERNTCFIAVNECCVQVQFLRQKLPTNYMWHIRVYFYIIHFNKKL